MAINATKDFVNFARSKGVPTTTTESVIKHQSKADIENVRTPYILEERAMRYSQIDVFSRLIGERIIWTTGPVTSDMSDVVSAQLLYLSSISTEDIKMYLNSPGGSVYDGLMIVDTMDLIKNDVATLNMSMCASMGSVLLSAGTKGKRSVLRYSKTMLHQSSSSSGYQNIQDAEINMKEWKGLNNLLIDILATNCEQDRKQLKSKMGRDFWLNANEAVQFGIADEIVVRRD